MLVVRAHNFVGARPAHSADNRATYHIGQCTRCSATATRVNYAKKAGEYIVNPGGQLLCISSSEGGGELTVGPVAGPYGTRPAVVKVDA